MVLALGCGARSGEYCEPGAIHECFCEPTETYCGQGRWHQVGHTPRGNKQCNGDGTAFLRCSCREHASPECANYEYPVLCTIRLRELVESLPPMSSTAACHDAWFSLLDDCPEGLDYEVHGCDALVAALDAACGEDDC